MLVQIKIKILDDVISAPVKYRDISDFFYYQRIS